MLLEYRSVKRIVNLLVWILILVLTACGTSRRIVTTDSGKDAYGMLGMERAHADNMALYREAASWIGVPHAEGGTSRRGTDCSFFVYAVYKAVYGKLLERNSAAMYVKNCVRVSKNGLKEGDLTFFNTGGKAGSGINHVGIYLKNNKFVHASSSRGVIVSDLEEPYYRKTWVCGGRVK
jgi:cell wall-associated NlpC family hydrolase